MSLRLAGPAVFFLAMIVHLGAEFYLFERPAFPLDDSWIHLQFARGLADGEGLVYNSGERINGSTAPLWTALLAVGFLLPGGLPLLWPKFLGWFFLWLAMRGARALASSLGMGPWGQTLAEVLVVSTPWLLWSASSGMEITLFAALALWGMARHQEESTDPGKKPRSMALLAVGCLARPEGLLLLAAALFERMTDRRPLTEKALGALPAVLVLVPVAAYFLWAGSLLPTTFHAKTRTDWNPLPHMAYLRSVLGILWESQPILSLLALAGGLRLALRGSAPPRSAEHRPQRLLPLFWLIGQPLAYAVMTSEQGPLPLGNFGRYYFPMIPLVIVLGLYALQPLQHNPPVGLGRRRLGVPALLAIALLVPQGFSFWKSPGRYLQTVANVEDSDVRAAFWLRDRLPPGAVLAVQDIGALKFFLADFYLVDLAGIVTPEVRELLRNDDSEVYWESRLAEYLQRVDVDYLVLFSASYPGISADGSGFTVLHRFPVENNVTMAGDELLVLRTPWSRAPPLAD